MALSRGENFDLRNSHMLPLNWFGRSLRRLLLKVPDGVPVLSTASGAQVKSKPPSSQLASSSLSPRTSWERNVEIPPMLSSTLSSSDEDAKKSSSTFTGAEVKKRAPTTTI
jgi:hypothetical protein